MTLEDLIVETRTRADTRCTCGECRFAKAVLEQLEERPRDDRISKPDRIRIDRGDYIRASGLVPCEVCGVVYFDHPTVAGARWLHRACDGRLLKL